MNTHDDAPQWSPTFLNARREAIVIFCCWAVGLVWAVPFCYFTGYPEVFDPANFSTMWGIPTWLFWGIGVPWLVADVFTTWFCFCFMKDDDLGGAGEGDSPSKEGGESS